MLVVIRILPVKWEDVLKVFRVRPADHLQEFPQDADRAAHVEVSGAEQLSVEVGVFCKNYNILNVQQMALM